MLGSSDNGLWFWAMAKAAFMKLICVESGWRKIGSANSFARPASVVFGRSLLGRTISLRAEDISIGARANITILT